jgi:hypothetical protein
MISEQRRGWREVAVLAIFVLVILVAIYMVERRSVRMEQVSIAERADHLRRIEALERRQDADDVGYANRGIVQRTLLTEAIKHEWFTPEQVRLLEDVAAGSRYPQQTQTGR